VFEKIISISNHPVNNQCFGNCSLLNEKGCFVRQKKRIYEKKTDGRDKKGIDDIHNQHFLQTTFLQTKSFSSPGRRGWTDKIIFLVILIKYQWAIDPDRTGIVAIEEE